MFSFIPTKWSLAAKVLPIITVILLVKFAVHQMGWEFISLNPLFNSIVAANVFLLGFLLAGTLSDYKESERLPGELAASLETIADECMITYKNKKVGQAGRKSAKEFLSYLREFTDTMSEWFDKNHKTNSLLGKLAGFSKYYLEFEPLTQPNFIVRLKQEQHNIRRMLIRIHTIRETSFVSVGYTIAEVTTGLLILGFIMSKISPFLDSVFFVGIATFLMIYMNFLIRDLDNPFDYYKGGKEAAHVSLRPLQELKTRLDERIKELK